MALFFTARLHYISASYLPLIVTAPLTPGSVAVISMMSRYRIAITVIGVFLSGMLAILAFGLRDLWRGWRSTGWPQVAGWVTASELLTRESRVETVRPGMERRPAVDRINVHEGNVFYPSVSYRYEVQGRAYESSQIGISGDISEADFSQAESVIAKYPVGTRVEVYHHPSDASVSVLEPGITEGALVQSILGSLFSLTFGGMLAFGLTASGRAVIETLTKSQSNDQHERHSASSGKRQRKKSRKA